MIQLRMLEHRLLRYLGIAAGCFIASCSINLFLVPAHLLTGGATGIAIIFYYLAGLPIGLQTFLYNVPLLAAAWKTLGRGYTIDVVVGTAIFSFCLDITRVLNAYSPIQDVMLAAIFGGVFNGIGYGLVFRMNGSTGGFDIVGAIIKKFYSFNMGGVIFSFNCLIMIAAAFLFGVAPAMFTLICMFMNAMVTDKVIAGFNSRKAVLIVSDRAEAIAEGIMEVGRGVTFLHGQGAFTRRERNVVFVVVTLTQVAKVKMIANAVDKNAFMIIMSANEVMGRGFSSPGVRVGNVIRRYEEHPDEQKP
ncbi:YitT family protein [Selenomonas montiformis]|uniref:YitT family protein n=1 Tax=Selenomonas montiformis TaxID=2652285 RepID=UPI003F969EE0